MGKYDPLALFLAEQAQAEVPMTFRQIESLIDAPLPPAATRHRAWWSNNPDNSVVTRAWRGAGFRAFQVDMAAGTVVFRRDEDPAVPAPGPAATSAGPQAGVLQRIRTRLGGTVKIPYGADLTAPTGEIWDAEIQ